MSKTRCTYSTNGGNRDVDMCDYHRQMSSPHTKLTAKERAAALLAKCPGYCAADNCKRVGRFVANGKKWCHEHV